MKRLRYSRGCPSPYLAQVERNLSLRPSFVFRAATSTILCKWPLNLVGHQRRVVQSTPIYLGGIATHDSVFGF